MCRSSSARLPFGVAAMTIQPAPEVVQPGTVSESKADVLPPANLFARRVAELHEALVEAVSADDVRQITAALVKRAAEGDVRAGRLVLSYALEGAAEDGASG